MMMLVMRSWVVGLTNWQIAGWLALGFLVLLAVAKILGLSKC